MMLALRSFHHRSGLRTAFRNFKRWQSTLEQNPYIHVFPHPLGPPGTSILTYLPTSPPNVELAIASTTQIPPTPESLTENPHFHELMQGVISDYATLDPDVQSQAKAFASTGGSGLGSGGAFFPNQPKASRRAVGSAREGGAGGASAQGGTGGAGVGGFMHVSDQRNPPDWGRIAWSEDIFGSLQVDAEGNFVGQRGEYQRSGTYRICTREGILGLTPFLRDKLIERLHHIERSQ